MSEVEITPIKLKLKEGQQGRIARLTVGALERQALAGVDGRGQPLTSKVDHRRLTLHSKPGASSPLWKEYSVTEHPEGAEVEFRKQYARYVFERFPESLELSPQFATQLEKEAASLIEESTDLIDEE